jgi:hypothetical protein
MIGAHAGGVDHRYKTINRTSARCLVCGTISECRITRYEEVVDIFFIKIKTLSEQYIFDWEKCNHRAVLYDKHDISRYKKDHVESGILSVPYYSDMKISKQVMPKKVAWYKIALVLLACTILGVLLGYFKVKYGIPFIP